MSFRPAIEASDLSKRYELYANPRDRLLQSLWRGRKQFFREFWALRNVSLEVGRGETLGIIGRNGSGKSTLLQIICKTLNPTSGTVACHGRIAALLELGAGFNPEFTGRENVELSASLLGLSPKEIQERLPSIIDFSEIGDFLDVPVKKYSSGMFVRLAFAVAISVDPDILVVDEALAVGDEAFQRKCFDRIQRFQKAGGTLLFVSHSAAVVVELCKRAILLEGGELIAHGTPKMVVAHYHRMLSCSASRLKETIEEIKNSDHHLIDSPSTESESIPLSGEKEGARESSPSQATRPELNIDDDVQHDADAFLEPDLRPKTTVHYDSSAAEILDPRIEDAAGNPVNNLVRGVVYRYVYDVDFHESARGISFGMLIKTLTGFELGGAATALPFEGVEEVSAGTRMRASFRFRCSLMPGTYFLNAGVQAEKGAEMSYLARNIDVAMFRVQHEPRLVKNMVVDFGISPDEPTLITEDANAEVNSK